VCEKELSLEDSGAVKFVATKTAGFMGRNLQRFHARVTK